MSRQRLARLERTFAPATSRILGATVDARLEQVFQSPAGKCRCGEPRWLICECSGLDQQMPPERCWKCSGRDPQGVHVIVETVDEHGEPIAAVEDKQ